MRRFLRRHALTFATLASFAILGAAGLVVETAWAHSPCATSATYSVRGQIKAFGPERRYVSIAHEHIPSFMPAMTMSFHPRHQAQLDGLAVNDKVQLTFTTTDDDDRRAIDSIRKE